MIRAVFRFIAHWASAQTRYAVHSPFVYQFVTQILPHRKSDWGSRVDGLRKNMLRSSREVSIHDLGAGYKGSAKPRIQKTLNEVARSSARRRRNGELLHRILRAYKPQNCLELGTNLGLSTLYQAGAVPEASFITIEGAEELAAIAQENTAPFGLPKIEIRVGDFAEQIAQLKKEGKRFDYVLLDGNHRYHSTVTYFKDLLPMLNPGALLIVDDINWSDGMRRAWKEIGQQKEVSVAIDLHFMGLCFVNRKQEKESFKFRFFPF